MALIEIMFKSKSLLLNATKVNVDEWLFIYLLRGPFMKSSQIEGQIVKVREK